MQLAERLVAFPGIGPWTAATITMRAAGDPDAFLAGDLGVIAAARIARPPGRRARVAGEGRAVATVAFVRRAVPLGRARPSRQPPPRSPTREDDIVTITTGTTSETTMRFDWSSPFGPLTLEADDRGRLTRLAFGDRPGANRRGSRRSCTQWCACGHRSPARGVLRGHAPFVRRRARAAGDGVPTRGVGRPARDPVRRDGELRRHRPHSGASRTRCAQSGQANGRNPIAIIVPCHRVIGSDHSLTGYGGGIDRKRFLLTLEGSLAAPTLDL